MCNSLKNRVYATLVVYESYRRYQRMRFEFSEPPGAGTQLYYTYQKSKACCNTVVCKIYFIALARSSGMERKHQQCTKKENGQTYHHIS